jgi:hypothetical protein
MLRIAKMCGYSSERSVQTRAKEVAWIWHDRFASLAYESGRPTQWLRERIQELQAATLTRIPDPTGKTNKQGIAATVKQTPQFTLKLFAEHVWNREGISPNPLSAPGSEEVAGFSQTRQFSSPTPIEVEVIESEELGSDLVIYQEFDDGAIATLEEDINTGLNTFGLNLGTHFEAATQLGGLLGTNLGNRIAQQMVHAASTQVNSAMGDLVNSMATQAQQGVQVSKRSTTKK